MKKQQESNQQTDIQEDSPQKNTTDTARSDENAAKEAEPTNERESSSPPPRKLSTQVASKDSHAGNNNRKRKYSESIGQGPPPPHHRAGGPPHPEYPPFPPMMPPQGPPPMMPPPDFYLRHYISNARATRHQKGFTKIEIFGSGFIKYRNHTGDRYDKPIVKEFFVNEMILEQMKEMVRQSGILSKDISDEKWPKASGESNSEGNGAGRRRGNASGSSIEELEIHLDDSHISLKTRRIDSMSIDVLRSEDPEGLAVFFNFKKAVGMFVKTLIRIHTQGDEI